MRIWFSDVRSLWKKRGAKKPPFMRPLSLLDAVEFSADGTSRDETLRHFADQLLECGFVRSDELFISSYDVVEDREIFIPVGNYRRVL